MDIIKQSISIHMQDTVTLTLISRLVVGVFLSTIASISAVISGLIWEGEGATFLIHYMYQSYFGYTDFIAKYLATYLQNDLTDDAG